MIPFRALLSAAAALLLAACDKKAEPEKGTGSSATPPKKDRPDKLANGQPAAVTLKHVLISFGDKIPNAKVKRTQEEALNVAYDVVARAKRGEDFDKLMKELSDDNPEGGTYTLVNEGVEAAPGEYPRGDMVPAFGDVGFLLEVGQIGFAEFHPTTSKFGYHIIKRVK